MSPQSDLFYEQSLAPLNSQSGDPDLHQWFTPFWAAEMFANDVLDGLGHVGVIEPSCGTGSFLSAIPQHLQAYGVDIDSDIAAVATANYGRPVIIEAFLIIKLQYHAVSVILGHPPFTIP